VKNRFRFIKFNSLAFRFGLYFLTGIVIIFLLDFGYTFFYTVRIMRDDAKVMATIITGLVGSRITNVLLPIEHVPVILTHLMENRELTLENVRKASRNYVLENPIVFGSGIFFEPYQMKKDRLFYGPYYYETNGEITEKHLGCSEYNYFKLDWYLVPKMQNRRSWSEPYFDKGGGEILMCTYSVPFYKKETGRRVLNGVLTMDISLASLDKIVSAARIKKTTVTLLVSRKGNIITCPWKNYISRNIKDISAEKDSTNRLMVLLARALRGKSGFVKVVDETRVKKTYWFYYAPVGSNGWTFGIVFPEEDLSSDFLRFFKNLFFIFLLSVVALFVVVLWITRRFTRPIRQLVVATKRIGQGDFHALLPVYRSRNEITELTDSFSLMQEELKIYIRNLRETMAAKKKIENEIEVAASIQRGLLPSRFPERKDCEFFAVLEPAKVVGGDMYDFFFPDDDHIYLALGDVSGKGIPASLFMAITRTLFRSLSIGAKTPDEIMRKINIELCKENPNSMFVTSQIFVADLKTGEVQVCNAGHNPPFIRYADGTVNMFDCRPGVPLGVIKDAEFRTESFFLKTGEFLIIYTDGITEAENRDFILFGENRLQDVLSSYSPGNAAELVKHVMTGLKSFTADAEQSDDITLLVFHFIGQSGSSSGEHITVRIRNELSELETIRTTIGVLAGKWNITNSTAKEINLILEELFTNIIFYAFDDESEHTITLEFEYYQNVLTMILEDDGKPFSLLEQEIPEIEDVPHEQRKIGGLGIHFVKELTDEIGYRRDGNKNIVTLKKYITNQ